MKFLFTFLCILWSGMFLQAESISREAAQKTAQQFFMGRGKYLSQDKLNLAHRAPQRGAGPRSSKAAYYVFNADNNQGYVLVSGDSRAEAILGYADVGHFDWNSVPEHVKAFLQGYTDEMAVLEKKNSTTPSRRLAAPSEKAVRTIAPMLPVLWNQDAPYNWQMPKNALKEGETKHVTGCVATAMAQVMSHHKHPAATIAEIPAYIGKEKNSSYSVQVPAIPAGTVIDWDNMRPTYGTSYPQQAGEAVARLMSMCATSVGATFRKDETSAPVADVADALKDKFDYDATTRYVRRSSYNSREWFDLIYGELLEQRPVLYGGQSSKGGHAFVLDGFDGKGYFHVNWGWGGMANGYFRLSVMRPGSAGIGGVLSEGYNSRQEAVIGVRPNTGETPSYPEREHRLTTDNYRVIEVFASSIKNVSCIFANHTSWKNTFEFGWAIVEENGTLNRLVHRTIQLKTGYYIDDFTFPELPSSLIGRGDGVYKLVPISRRKGTSTWWPSTDAKHEYVEAKVLGKNVTFRIVLPNKQLVLAGHSIEGTRMVNSVLRIRVDLRNSGSREYDGEVFLWNKEGTVLLSKRKVVVPAGETITAVFDVIPDKEGSFVYELSVDQGRKQMMGSFSVVVSSNNFSGTLILDKVKLLGANSDGPGYPKILGKAIEARFAIRNPTSTAFGEPLAFSLYAGEGGSSTSYYSVSEETRVQRIEAGKVGFYNVKFDELDLSKKYILTVKYKGKELSTSFRSYITFLPSVELIMDDGRKEYVASSSSYTVPDDVVAVDFSTVKDMNFVPNSKTNTLYILANDAQIPASLQGKNVVRDGRIEQLTLSDEQPFYTPVPFTADRVVYTRAVKEGTSGDGKGWETIVLPFSPQYIKVQGEDRELTWRKQAGDDGKFWLRQFTGINGGSCYFNDAQSFEAFTPYIVAFPGRALGKLSLAGKILEYSAEQVYIPAHTSSRLTTSRYSFVGAMIQKNESNTYVLDATGSVFRRQDAATILPFRASFHSTDNFTHYAPALKIAFDGTLTALGQTPSGSTLSSATPSAAVYNLSGQLVGKAVQHKGIWQLQHLPKGVYVVQGQRVMR